MSSSPSAADQLQQLEFRVQSLTQANQRLYRQQEQFRTTFAQAAVGIVHMGVGGEFLMVNPTFCKIVGYGPDELTQTTFMALIYSKDWTRHREEVDKLLAGEVDTIDIEHRYRRDNQALIWVHATLSLVRREDGAPDYMIMVVHDISDRKQVEAERLQAQETLRRTTSRLQTLIQNLQAGVLLVDDEGEVVLTNRIFQQLFQLDLRSHSQERLAYVPIVKAVAQRMEQSKQFVAVQRHTLRDRQLTVQRPWQLVNGRIVEENFIPIWMGEEFAGHLWLFRDVTDQRQAEVALRQQYQQLLLLRRLTHEVRQTLDPQLMFQTTVDGIGSALQCDRCHLYLYHPQQRSLACAAEYLAPEQASLRRVKLPVENNCFVQVVLAEDAAIASSNIDQDPLLKDMVDLCRAGNVSALVAVRISYQNRPNGLLVIHQCGDHRKWTDGDLEILEAVAAQVGIALAQVKLLTQEKDQRQQLALQNQELEVARKTAESASHAKGDFLATMSHEIRTPLNAVIGMTGLLMETSLTGQQAEWLEVLRSSSETLLALINDILDYSKIESGQLELEQRPLKVSQCVQESLTLVGGLASSKGLALHCAIAEDVPPVVMGDTVRLRQVLVNLLSNAVKFTDQGTVTVTVTARAIAPEDPNPSGDATADSPPGDTDGEIYELQFDVQDTGIGISPEQQTQLFKSFSQVDASITRRYGGTGLGLAICLRLTRLMQGRLWVDSKLGAGSTFHFTVTLPQGAAAVMPSALLGRSGHNSSLMGKHLWVIDDNPVNRQFLVHNGKQWGMAVTAFQTAEAALASLRQDQPAIDAMVVDWRLPGIDGVEFAEALKDFPPYDQVPLVLLTGVELTSKARAAVEEPFQVCLQNPITRETLHGVLVRVLFPEVQHLGEPLSTKGAKESGTLPSPLPAAAPLTADPESPNPLRLLLAEDNPVNQQVASLMLERLGYRADVVSDGLEVLAALKRNDYDVILMDVEMPQMDGITATREIQKRYPPAARPQVVALTAYAMDEDRDRCLAAGMDDYITKPIRKNTLLDVLYRAEHRSGGGPESQGTEGEGIEGNLAAVRSTEPASMPSEAPSSPTAEEPGEELNAAGSLEVLEVSEAAIPRTPPPVPAPPLPNPDFLPTEAEGEPESVVTQVPWTLEEDGSPVLDGAVVEGLLAFGENRDRVLSMVEKAVTLFCEDVTARLAAIDQALTTRDALALRKAAHALRSSSVNLGAQQLASYCSQLESLGRTTEPDPLPEMCPTTLQTLQTAYDAANHQLKDVLNR